MKFLTLALDFDGTIAQSDVLHPDVRRAIAELRAKGIVVLLVTGRILEDLRRVAGDLHFVDGIVGENGAVIEFPASGYSEMLGQPPPASLLAALEVQGIHISVGKSIVDADAREAPRILAILQHLELPLVLIFNRGRVMVLPQAISKATGLHTALTILRLSEHNAVAIGDAENDHELLRASEVGVAVAWGSDTLKKSADYVLPGDGPAAVADYLRELVKSSRVPKPTKARRRLLVGHTDDGLPFALALKGRNVMVAGDSKSGKSWVTGLLCEQLILYGYCLCIIDPEGDYTSLEALPRVVTFGGADPLPSNRDLLRALRHADVSIVIDLSHTPHAEKVEYVRRILPALANLRRHTGLPHQIVVDEAHYFLHGHEIRGSLDLEQNGYILVTYRASAIGPEVLATAQAIIVTRESDPHEADSLRALCHLRDGVTGRKEWRRELERLVIGEAVALPITEEAQDSLKRIRLAPRLTPHVRHLAKYIDIPVSESRAFVFWSGGAPMQRKAHTLREFVEILEHLPATALDNHVRRGNFSTWIANVFGDYPLANSFRQLEDKYCAGQLGDIAASLRQTVRSRYEFLDSSLAAES